MENQEKATITLDDKEYVVEDLPQAAQYCLQQVQDLQQQANAARARVDQLAMAEQGFISALREELAKSEEEAEEVTEG
jgi:hypothetical protein